MYMSIGDAGDPKPSGGSGSVGPSNCANIIKFPSKRNNKESKEVVFFLIISGFLFNYFKISYNAISIYYFYDIHSGYR